MYPSRTLITALNACRIICLILMAAAWTFFGTHQSQFGYFVVALVFAGIAAGVHMELDDRLEIPAEELRNDADPFLRDLARQLPEKSARHKAYIRVPMKRLRGKPCSSWDVKVAMTETQLDYDFYSSTACRRYRVKENGKSYSLEYCDMDAQFSVQLPIADER